MHRHVCSLVVTAFLYVLTAASISLRYGENGHWVTTWTAVPQASESRLQPPEFFNSENNGLTFANSTIRQTVRVTLGANQLRFRFSNAFGKTDLPITKVTVARPYAEAGQNTTGASGINANTLQTLTYGGDESITIPTGALIVSDPLEFATTSNEVLSVSMYLSEGQPGQYITTHRVSRTHSWLALGDHTEIGELGRVEPLQRKHGWYFISAVEAWLPATSRAFAILGDSITDGAESTMNGDSRWPNLLFNRMQKVEDSNLHGT